MKLTEAQARIIEEAKANIDFARTHTIREWAIKEQGLISEEYIDSREKNDYKKYGFHFRDYAEGRIANYIANFRKYYEQEKQAICFCNANSRTLEKLEQLGLIEIIKDGRSYTDVIKVLNY